MVFAASVTLGIAVIAAIGDVDTGDLLQVTITATIVAFGARQGQRRRASRGP
jgi:hypothetical protein